MTTAQLIEWLDAAVQQKQGDYVRMDGKLESVQHIAYWAIRKLVEQANVLDELRELKAMVSTLIEEKDGWANK